MLGPSGSGKTTTLRMIAGFETPDSGSVELAGEDVSRLPPYDRPVNTVFQDYALFPHMTVQKNVEYGLMVKKVSKDERRTRAAEALEMVRLGGYGGRKPSELSGGQRQRVALARAIVNRPKVLLLDEPLGALDLKLRQEMQIELKAIQQEVGITFVYVTHDQEEALTMSDRIAVFNEGRIEQIGPPAEVYEHPQSEFIAGFVGVSNVIERDGRRVHGAPGEDRHRRPNGAAPSGMHVEEGVVRDVQYVGPVTRYHVTLDRGGELQVLAQNLEEGSSEVLEAKGRRVRLAWRPEQESAIEEAEEGTHMKHRKRRTSITGGARPDGRCARASSRQVAAATTRRAATGRSRVSARALEEIQENAREEGQVNIVQWPGYATLVDEFTAATGCKVATKDAGTGDDMISLIQSGEYDGVSASGHTSVRLMAAGDVAPVNADLLPNYADVPEGIKLQSYNSKDGEPFGAPHGRGPNLLVFRTDEVTPAPDSWSAIWDENTPSKGKISIYDDSIFIADAAVYLKATQPDLGIENPYQLTQEQFDALRRAAEDARARTSASGGSTTRSRSSRSRTRTAWSARRGRCR